MALSNKFAIALVVCFVALAYASPYENDEEEIDLPGIMLPPSDSFVADVDADPTPCCFPKQWQGNVTGQSGSSPSRRGEDEDVDRRHGGGSRRGGGFQQKTTTVFVDADKKSIAGRSATRNDTAAFIVVFGESDTADFYMYLMGAQKCFHKKANHAVFHQQCVPVNATYGGTVSVGPKDKGLSVEIWNFHGRHHRNSTLDRPSSGGVFISGRALVTPDRPCIPVFLQNHGLISNRPGPRPHRTTTTTTKNGLKFQSNDVEFTDDDDSQSELDEELNSDRPGRRGGSRGFMGSAVFTNIESTVKDPTVFNPPEYCKKAQISGNTLQVGVDIEYPDLLDTFVSME